jgi:hypothetical protein
MNQREKMLSWLVGGAVFFVLNFYAVKFLLGNKKTLADARAKIETEMQFLRQQESERELWSQRDAWLNDSLQPMGDPDVAYQNLSKAVQTLGKKYTVTLEAPQQGFPSRQPLYTTQTVKLQAKATWPQMFDYIQELQAPGQFLSLEGDLKVDAADKTQLRVDLTIAKWYQAEAKK